MKKTEIPVKKSHRALATRIPYLITTINKNGDVNAAPFSNLTSVSTNPERIVLAVYHEWDTKRNIVETQEFVVNVPSKNLLEQIWICGDKYAGHPIPEGVNELDIAGLKEIPSVVVKPPRVEECYAHLECKVVWTKDVGNHELVLADIVAASATEGIFDENLIPQIGEAQPLLEISSGYFTSPGEIVRVERKEITEKVNKRLKEMKIEISEELRKYKGFDKLPDDES